MNLLFSGSSKKIDSWRTPLRWAPSQIFSPQTVEDVKSILAQARKGQKHVRFVGSSHSTNDLCATFGYQVITDRLNRVLSIDPSNHLVRVEGGIKIKNLAVILASQGLALPNQGYINTQSLAGAIGTATHGSGTTGSLSSFVHELELIDAKGNIHLLSPHRDPHLFSAALVHLGCMGMIYSVTLKCQPLFKIQVQKRREHLDVTLSNMFQYCDEFPYFQFMIDPYVHDTIVWESLPVNKPIRNRLGYQVRRSLGKTLSVLSFDILPTPSFLVPTLIDAYKRITGTASCVDHSHQILSPSDEGNYVEEEIALPLNKLLEGIQTTRKIIDRHSHRVSRMVAMILVRFVAQDPHGYMSPTNDGEKGYISLICIKKRGYENFYKEFENALLLLGGKPHWGKENFLTKEKVKMLYHESYTNFCDARAQLDPKGLFLNSYIENLFT